MALRIYNTMTHKKEEFQTLEPNRVRMYVCGPTVYNKAHVGHAMSALVFDIIRRYLDYRGYQVSHAMNFTDVDDKIILRANEMKVDPFALAEGYIREFEQNLADLNILPATIKPRATQEIPQILKMVQDLIDNGYAYPLNGDVYFRVRKDEDYGRLSGRKLEDMQAGARIDVDSRKEDPMDFALWKSARPGEPSWESPWGPGRPGWHIECSAMNLTHLGEQIDIHGGGNDLIFPHHENEIAQTESLTGKPFARYWVHNGMLQLGGEKMSKSLGNLVTIEDFLAQHPADALRLMVLTSSYRGPLTFNDEVIATAERGVERLRSALRPALPGAAGAPQSTLDALAKQMETTQATFIESMDDDFNSSGAVAGLYELVRSINQARADGARDAELAPAQAKLRELGAVLGLTLQEEQRGAQGADPFVDLLVELRTEMRKQKQWAFSDLIRDRLAALGVVLEDSKEGTRWRWNA
ncbi:cysteine--tRNA ligase [Levilinea saccharolytica]|uniref:Cysteine--tRNA ligase n=1 Tax=Levilinea saccharolytica TaxID=229921 RepID=A0A0N8GT48_9CHLR|nr:cysteine--tRNA ligase [Levilinea saccharolytica]KPL91098.1 cysteinyl-tRNA synthetase [Levilinea saccharolytica]GAP16858.1 cysteinyl-tRNA synthetase [Levilinea saccharolytica]